MDTVADKFTIIDPKQGKILQLSFAVMFFYNKSEDRKRQAVILDILDEHCAMTGNIYRWTQNPQTNRWKRLKDGINSYISPREWVLTNPNYRWSIIYHSGQKSSDASDVELYTFNRGDTPDTDMTSFLRVHFPLAVLDDARGIAERIRLWSELLQPDHGYAGFSLVQSHGFERDVATSYEYSIAQRFPGIDIYANVPHSLRLGRYIKGAQWLTILSNEFLAKIGGVASVKEKMVDLPVLEYAGGAVLQAGPLPQIGDVEQDIPMTDYKRVAAIVEPLRHKNYGGGAPMLAPGPKFDAHSYMAWLARFSPQPK
jgi:hypothetical protein